jgi:hypothetical protein
MKRIGSTLLVIALAFICISWGTTGHFAIGLIAERHLTPQAKNAVRDLLGEETLPGISTWADDIKGQKAYKATGPWHYINLPVGLDSQAFVQRVVSMPGDNVYKAVLRAEKELRSPGTTRKEKAEALKFLVHLVGDLHQPMHVGRAEDKGGNLVQVQYKGKGSNLHTVWDSKLLEDEGLDYKVIAGKYDNISEKQVRQWQKDELLRWIWESYKISSQLYREIETGGRKLGNEYYKSHIDIANERMEKAGIRLAGMLNSIFSSSYRMPAKGDVVKEEAARTVKVEEAAKHIGEYATVCSKVYGHKDLSGLTLVNLGDRYPNQLMTVVLKGDAKSASAELDGRKICVTGMIIDYKGKPEIIVTDPKKLVLSSGR